MLPEGIRSICYYRKACQRAIIIRSSRSRERAIEASKKSFARLEAFAIGAIMQRSWIAGRWFQATLVPVARQLQWPVLPILRYPLRTLPSAKSRSRRWTAKTPPTQPICGWWDHGQRLRCVFAALRGKFWTLLAPYALTPLGSRPPRPRGSV